MVKISIKKEEKTIKARQKQKQRQSQRVVVNIGKDVMKAKRRRAPRQTLQKNKVDNKPTQINVPQALPIQQQQPQQPMNELIKYIKENEKQKETIKEKEQKINELEKDKKDKERSKVLTEDEVQNDFSNVYSNSNISSLTNSGTATPRISYPVNSNDLITALRRESDLRNENPNSGQISFATLQSNLSPFSSNKSQTTFSSLTSNQSSLPSIASSKSQNTLTTLATNNTNQSSLPSMRSFTTQDSISSQSSMPSLSSSSTLPDDLTSFISQPPEPVEETIPNEELVIEEEPEKQMVVFGPQRAGSSSITATEQTIPNKNIIDNSIPAFLRPINTPLPSINIKDIIGQRPTVSETKDIRRARIDKLDKKPLLAIEPKSSQDEANDTIKLLENILKPKPPTPTKPPTPPPQKAAEEPDNEEVGSSIEGYDEFQKYITDKEKKRKKEITNGTLGKMLIKNKITDPTTGKVFVLDSYNRVHVKGNSTALNNTQLTELLLNNYKPGFVYKKIS
jgi:hypothetical protein